MRINNFLLLAVTATVQLSSLPFTSATRMCTKGLSNYGCGAGYQEDGYFDEQAGDNCICCCRHEDGGGFHDSVCDGIKDTPKGCGSCMGWEACKVASNAKIGDNSCVNDQSCKELKDSYIKKHSCRSDQACKQMERTSVGTNSCGIGSGGDNACLRLWDSTIGDNSCQGNKSCTANKLTCDPCPPPYTRRLNDVNVDYDHYGKNVTIRNNACNMKKVCAYCENDSVVPDDACNGNKNDTTIGQDGYTICNYCRVSSEHSCLELPLPFFTHSDPNPLLCTCTPLKNSPHYTALH